MKKVTLTLVYEVEDDSAETKLKAGFDEFVEDGDFARLSNRINLSETNVVVEPLAY